MIHVRIDGDTNDKRRFACGLGPALPEGDKWVGADEHGLHDMVDCMGCGGHKRVFGTPISQLSGQPGHEGYAEFKRIAASWGHE